MKASDKNEVLNNVLNHRRYSRRAIVSILFAFVMVTSAFVIAAGSTMAANTTPAIDAWRLLPDEKWTKGDVKGYSEGDVIPVNLTLTDATGSGYVGVRLGFEWGKYPGTENEIRGFDEVVKYNYVGLDGLCDDPPYAPYNNPVEDPAPFYAEPDLLGPKGVLTQTPVPSNDISGQYEDDNRYWIAWDLMFDFGEGFDTVKIFSGGLLFITTEDTFGASYYRGSSLHIRILDILDEQGVPMKGPGAGGSQDIPINVLDVMSPPKLMLMKTFNPDVRAPNELTTVTLEIQNHGQSDAYLLDLFDFLPSQLTYLNMLETWTSHDSTRISVVYDPLHDDEEQALIPCVPTHDEATLHFDFGTAEDPTALTPYALLHGTAFDGTLWVRYFSFVVRVNADATPQTVTNEAEITYTNDHGSEFDPEYAEDDLVIIKVAVSVTKVATIEQEHVECAGIDYDVDGNGYIDPDSGDTVFYVITVTNDGTEPIRFEVYDEKIGGSSLVPIWVYPGAPPEVMLIGGASVSKSFPYTFTGEDHTVPWVNTANVKAWDAAERSATASTTETLDLVYPDATITKVASCEVVMKEGEVIDYTITIQNIGDSTLRAFTVVDEMLNGLVPLYEAKLLDEEDELYDEDDLSPGETLVLKSKGTPEPGVVIVGALAYHLNLRDVVDGKIINEVVLEAYDHQGHYLKRTATEEVLYLWGDIQITKTAVVYDGDEDPTNDVPDDTAGVSGMVYYRVDVENTGDVGLWWYYWDSMEDPWTPVPASPDPVWQFPTDSSYYYIGGCWVVEPEGVYCAQVPVAGEGEEGFIGISTHDDFVGEEFVYEVKIYPFDNYWRAGAYFRYDETTGDGYVAAVYDGGVVLYKVVGKHLTNLGAYSAAMAKDTWHTVKIRVEGVGAESFFDVFLDGNLAISVGDTNGLGAGKIGLAVWDEHHNSVHIHFDQVLVTDLDEIGVYVWDDFETLEPMDALIMTALPFPVPDGVPPELKCSYDARLWTGYLAPGAKDFRYYSYEIQDDDEDPLVDVETVYGWHTQDGTTETGICCPDTYVTDDDDETVYIKGWIEGWVYYDYDLDHSGYPDGVTETGLAGWTVQLYNEFWVAIPGKSFVTLTGYYIFDDLNPGDYYVRESKLLNPELWFPTNPTGYDSTKLTVVAHLGTEWDFGNALWAYIEGVKWLDWNMNRNQDQPPGGMEPFLNGWVIHLQGWEIDDPQEDEEGNPLPYTVEMEAWTGDSDKDGKYLVGIPPEDPDEAWSPGYFQFKVKPGTYVVWEEFPEDNPATLVDESDWFETFPNPTPPQTYPGKHEHIQISFGDGPTITDKDFGNVPLTTIWGYKYYDKDMMGDHDTTDPGLNGWTITLTGNTVNEAWYPFVDMSTTTATHETKDGWYQFAHLMPGTYAVGETMPTGQEDDWYMTTDAELLDFEFLSPVVPGISQLDIGNMRYASIVGYKFVDTYEGDPADPDWPNGMMDEDEYGYPGWKLHFKPLSAESEDPALSPFYTAAGEPNPDPVGWYEITKLVPGQYEVWEELLEYWVPTTPSRVVVTIPYHYTGAPVEIRLDFGNILPDYDPEVPFLLEKGWNLWSTSVQVTGLTAKGLLSSIGPNAVYVSWYDEATGLYHSYKTGWSDAYDFAVEFGTGYFVYVKQKTWFTLTGDTAVGPSSVALVKGWNLVGYNLLHEVMASALLKMVSGCTARYVSWYDPATGLYHSYKAGWSAQYDFAVVPGKGYFLYAEGAGTLVFS